MTGRRSVCRCKWAFLVSAPAWGMVCRLTPSGTGSHFCLCGPCPLLVEKAGCLAYPCTVPFESRALHQWRESHSPLQASLPYHRRRALQWLDRSTVGRRWPAYLRRVTYLDRGSVGPVWPTLLHWTSQPRRLHTIESINQSVSPSVSQSVITRQRLKPVAEPEPKNSEVFWSRPVTVAHA